MDLRPYDPPAHRAACLALFDGNVTGPDRPAGAFQPGERTGFAAFLDRLPGPFFVLVEGDEPVACGGWAAEDEPGVVSLCWTVVAADRQGRGTGRRLVAALVEDAREAAAGAPTRMRLETVPATRGFFEAMGFRVVSVEPGGYGPEMPPRVEMARSL